MASMVYGERPEFDESLEAAVALAEEV